jgi:D-serine deaminase-like pyridoxal phosphate-dependent protein
MAAVQHLTRVTVAVDSVDTIDAAAAAGVEHVLIDVQVGLPRCGCAPADAARLADHARAKGLHVRGVMGYEGHLMVVADAAQQRAAVDEVVATLLQVHGAVGGEIISSGGTGTFALHPPVDVAEWSTYEVQAGSYALMDSHYAAAGAPFEQACWVLGTVISVSPRFAVADVGLKALGMDHGNPPMVDATPWFYSDEHVSFASERTARVGDRVRVTPAHIDPTMAMHDAAWLVLGDEVLERWPIDLRGW